MVILGMLLIGIGIITVLAGVFVSGVDDGRLELLNFGIAAPTLFLIGVFAGAFILWGFTILKYGTKRELAHRRESKRLTELSQKLEKVEAERREKGEAEGSEA